MRWVKTRCLDCGKEREVRQVEMARGRKPQCLSCGGTLTVPEADSRQVGRRHQPEHARRLVPGGEEQRHEFWTHPTWYYAYKSGSRRAGIEWPADFTPEVFYNDELSPETRKTHKDATGRDLEEFVFDCYAENHLYAAGKPYYKVWPSIASALCDTEMLIPGRQLLMPFQAFEVRLPKVNNPLFPVCAIVCCRMGEDECNAMADWGADWLLGIFFHLGVPGYYLTGAQTMPVRATVPIRKDQLLEHSLAEVNSFDQQSQSIIDAGDFGGRSFQEIMQHVMRVCVGVCFFGMDNHELVLPELTRRTIERFHRERRQPTPHEAEKALREARDCDMFGFKVGSEIDLPRPHVVDVGDALAGGEGRELTAGYVRRGHMRMQPCGKGRQQERLVFVRPHVVRPDLPLRTSHGYRVHA